MLFITLITLIVAIVVMAVSGRYTIRFLSNVTDAFGISEFTVAFIILALATSMPELFIAISSSFHNAGELVIATVFGSNIVNTTLIVGLIALLSGGISTSQLYLKRDIMIGVVITLLPFALLLDGTLSQIDGVVLIGAFLAYLIQILRDKSSLATDRIPRRILYGAVHGFLALVAIAILIFAADATVNSSVDLAAAFGIPTFLIGLFLLSIGSSLPEFVTTLHSNRQKKPGMVLGNIIGSNISNSSLVLGVASVIRPIHVEVQASFVVSAFFVILSIVLLSYFASKKQDLSILDGLKLLGVFALFVLIITVIGATDIVPTL